MSDKSQLISPAQFRANLENLLKIFENTVNKNFVIAEKPRFGLNLVGNNVAKNPVLERILRILDTSMPSTAAAASRSVTKLCQN